MALGSNAQTNSNKSIAIGGHGGPGQGAFVAGNADGAIAIGTLAKVLSGVAATVSKARLCGLLVDKRQSVPSCAGFEDADSLPELFDRIAIHFGRPTAMALLAALESIFELPDLETMEPEGTA